jgi:hypothetical protein
MNGSPFDKEIMNQLGQLLDKGFLVIPIDPEVKARYYDACVRNVRNPHDQLRKDVNHRIKIFDDRERKAKEQEEKEKAEKQSFLQQTATKLRTNEPDIRKDK